jgi:hypothetical protein
MWLSYIQYYEGLQVMKYTYKGVPQCKNMGQIKEIRWLIEISMEIQVFFLPNGGKMKEKFKDAPLPQRVNMQRVSISGLASKYI